MEVAEARYVQEMLQGARVVLFWELETVGPVEVAQKQEEVVEALQLGMMAEQVEDPELLVLREVSVVAVVVAVLITRQPVAPGEQAVRDK